MAQDMPGDHRCENSYVNLLNTCRWTHTDVQLLIEKNNVPDQFQQPVTWAHLCILVLAFEERHVTNCTVWNSLATALRTLQPDCCLPSTQWLRRNAKKRMQIMSHGKLMVPIEELKAQKEIISESLEKMGITVHWLTEESTPLPQNTPTINNSHMVDISCIGKKLTLHGKLCALG
ncbi:uncharacterized protein [Amphiura filiformis]|uniref:uncharacterized protein n=1 Tax=Amphiura filiformis TaxID=82378 RepID=UPI003B2184DB